MQLGGGRVETKKSLLLREINDNDLVGLLHVEPAAAADAVVVADGIRDAFTFHSSSFVQGLRIWLREPKGDDDAFR